MHPITCLDVGGSSVKSGLVINKQLRFFSRNHYDSTAQWRSVIACFASLTHRSVSRIAFSFPGPADYEKGVVYIQGQAKLGSLYKKNLRRLIADATQVPIENIRMRNDAEAAIVGEARYGIHATEKRILGITLGTGIGSAVVEKGQPLYMPHEYSDTGEFFPIPVGDGIADEEFSARGILRIASEHGISATSVIDIARDAERGNPDARRIFEEFGTRLGIFLESQARRIQPEIVVLKGGISNALSLFGRHASAQLSVPLLKGSLGDHAALFGAAELFDQAVSL